MSISNRFNFDDLNELPPMTEMDSRLSESSENKENYTSHEENKDYTLSVDDHCTHSSKMVADNVISDDQAYITTDNSINSTTDASSKNLKLHETPDLHEHAPAESNISEKKDSGQGDKDNSAASTCRKKYRESSGIEILVDILAISWPIINYKSFVMFASYGLHR